VEGKHAKAVARVAIDRTIRFPRAVAERRTAASRAMTDLACRACGAVLCRATRVKLFSGMVLTCASCGELNPVPR